MSGLNSSLLRPQISTRMSWSPQHLKHVELRNLCCDDLDHLSSEVKLAMHRLRRKPTLVSPSLKGQDWSFERFSIFCVKD